MAFDQDNQGIPTPNINPQPVSPSQGGPTEQQVRTMRADLGTPTGLPTFDAEEPAFTPETTNQIPSVDQLVQQGGKKMPWMFIIGFAVLIVLALVGYFVIYPMFNKPAVETPVTPVQPIVTPTVPVAPVAPTVVHKTQFINAPSATVTEKLTVQAGGMVNQAEVKGVFVKIAQTAKTGATEIVFNNQDGNPLIFSKIMSSMAPNLTESELMTLTQNDFTAFVFKDGAGAWPGYIAELQAGATAEQIASLTKKIEEAPLKNFFIVDPGTLAAFKNGTVNTTSDRYSAGSTPGASFGYLITKNKLLISTSFAGMKETLRLMGL